MPVKSLQDVGVVPITAMTDEELDASFDRINALAEQHGLTGSCFSMRVAILDWLDQVAIEGEHTLTYAVNWGKIVSRELSSPTWLQLWQAADDLIARSGDTHHIFIEDIMLRDSGVLELITGS